MEPGAAPASKPGGLGSHTAGLAHPNPPHHPPISYSLNLREEEPALSTSTLFLIPAMA